MKSLCQMRRAFHMGRVVPSIDPDLAERVTEGSVHLKKIITRRNYGNVDLPAKLQTVAELRLRQYGDRRFRQDARSLHRIMSKLKLPDDKHTLKMKSADIKTELEVRDKFSFEYDPSEFTPSEEISAKQDELHQLILGTIEDRRRDWHYYEYDERASLLYMAMRLGPNYASLKTIMNEIHDLDPSFTPKTVLDFGSGMGTTIWAVSETWPNSVSEFMNIELSREQQYLCEYLLRDGKHQGESLPGIYHRQYLPTSTKSKYDIVVAAFAMLELPNSELRTNVIENLWHKTNDLLVLVERGNRGGFAAINEARQFILDMAGHDVTKRMNLSTETGVKFSRYLPQAHVFAPCSHDFSCPRAKMPSKKDMDICRFKVFYEPLCIGEQKPGNMMETFSYVILRKKPNPSYLTEGCPMRWPRIVEKRKKSNGQVTHKICCPNGNLAETTITKKYGKATYELAKSCDWGDLLPIRVKDEYFSRNSKLLKSS